MERLKKKTEKKILPQKGSAAILSLASLVLTDREEDMNTTSQELTIT